MNIRSEKRLQGIDVLRGLSVLFVVLHHIHLRFQLNGYPVADLLPHPLGRVVFWSGYYSVIVFFVISGFLITRLSLQRWGSFARISIKHFYGLRSARILPCLLALLAVSSALHLLAIPAFTINPERASLGRSLFAALTFHLNWLEGMHGYLPGNWDVLWSLSVEETFYLLFPLACVFLRTERLVLILISALIVAGPINRVALAGQRPWDDYAYLSCMDGIAFGCLAAWISARLSLGKAMLRSALAFGLASIALIVVLRQQTFNWGLTATGLIVTVLELGSSLVLLALVNGVGTGALSKGTGALQFIGRCSYEIYLTHMFVVLGAMQIVKALAPNTFILPAWYGLMLVLSVALGYVVARWFSEPANRYCRQQLIPIAGNLAEQASNQTQRGSPAG